jgi:hypothetical protein
MNIKQYTDDKGISYVDINGVVGHLYPGDPRVFASLVPKNGKYVETGSYLGCSAMLVAYLSEDTLIYCHDIWEQNMKDLPIESVPPTMVDDYFYNFYKNVTDNDMCRRIIPVRGDSKYTLGIH